MRKLTPSSGQTCRSSHFHLAHAGLPSSPAASTAGTPTPAPPCGYEGCVGPTYVVHTYVCTLTIFYYYILLTVRTYVHRFLFSQGTCSHNRNTVCCIALRFSQNTHCHTSTIAQNRALWVGVGVIVFTIVAFSKEHSVERGRQ